MQLAFWAIAEGKGVERECNVDSVQQRSRATKAVNYTASAAGHLVCAKHQARCDARTTCWASCCGHSIRQKVRHAMACWPSAAQDCRSRRRSGSGCLLAVSCVRGIKGHNGAPDDVTALQHLLLSHDQGGSKTDDVSMCGLGLHNQPSTVLHRNGTGCTCTQAYSRPKARQAPRVGLAMHAPCCLGPADRGTSWSTCHKDASTQHCQEAVARCASPYSHS